MGGIASSFVVDYWSIFFPTDNRGRIDYISPLLATLPRNTFPDEVYVNPIKTTVLSAFPTFRIDHKYPLPVNMGETMNKPQLKDKSVYFSNKTTQNILTRGSEVPQKAGCTRRKQG